MTTTPPSRPAALRATARDLLRGRLLLAMSSKDAESGVVDRLPFNLAPSGLVLTGKREFGLLARLRRAHPDLVIAYEPDADSVYYATVEAPFLLPDDDLFAPASLGRVLDDQREVGASFAVTPTGHLRPGDTDVIKAVIEATNALDRDDVVVRLPLDPATLRTDPRQLAAIAGRSRHPVALSLCADQDPMAQRGAIDGLRLLNDTVTDLGLWRTDQAAFLHLAEGGLWAVVGFIPSLRHGLTPEKKGRKNNRRDHSPHVLLPEHLRYMRVTEIQNRYAATEPPHCASSPCDGGPLDRFTAAAQDRLEAHEHNAVTLLELAGELARAGDAERRLAWWRSRLQRAIAAHEEAARLTRQHWPLPDVLEAWAKRQGVAVA